MEGREGEEERDIREKGRKERRILEGRKEEK